MSKSSDSAVAGAFAFLLVAGHLCLMVEAISPVSDIILTNSQAKDFEERERIKDQVTKEVKPTLNKRLASGVENYILLIISRFWRFSTHSSVKATGTGRAVRGRAGPSGPTRAPTARLCRITPTTLPRAPCRPGS